MLRIRRLARQALLASVLLATIGGALAVPAAPSVRAWDAGTFSSADESLLFTLTNQARASAGLAPLRNDSQLHSLAEWRAQDMSVRGYFSHEIPPQGYMVFHYMDQRGIGYVLAGENIGWDNASDDEATPMIQQMFMNSPEHRSNILGALWDSMGVGAYKGTDGKLMYCVLFMESKPAATPTPAPTATPEPVDTPPPTARPTPTRSASLTPSAADTPAPVTPTPPTASPTETPALTDSPVPTAGPTDLPTLAPSLLLTPVVSPAAAVSPAALPAPQPGQSATSQRILDDAPSPGLLEWLMSSMLGLPGSI